MFCSKYSIGVNLCKELPDDLDDSAKHGGGLVEMFGLELRFKPMQLM